LTLMRHRRPQDGSMDTSTRGLARADGDLRLQLLRSLVAPTGTMIALGLAVALIPIRTHLGRPLVLLPFAVLVLATSAAAGVLAGAACALVASMSIDTFLHRPYGVLGIGHLPFWSSAALLLALAMIAGARRHPRHRAAR
jgi:hypothetical protein